MRAAVYDQYGGPDVVRIEEVPTPEPAANEVRVAVHATTVASGDWRMRSAEIPPSFRWIAPLFFGRRPKRRILGTELAGIVDAVGARVTRWKTGDHVFAFPGSNMGAHCEFICLPENGRIARKPTTISFARAAALSFGGSTTLSFIDKAGGLRYGDRVLVVGASGAVGSAMVQLAKHDGAEVTAVTSAGNAELVELLGATHTIDYQAQDFADLDARYDVIMDTTGTAPIARCKRVLKQGGRILIVDGSLGDMVRAPFTRGARVVAGPAREDPAHLPRLAALAESGAFTPLIDSTFAFEDIVKAHRRVDSRRKRGSVVVVVQP